MLSPPAGLADAARAEEDVIVVQDARIEHPRF